MQKQTQKQTTTSEKENQIYVTIDDIENERVEFQKGIFVFLADNLLELRARLRASLVPKEIRRGFLKDRVIKPIITKF